MASIRIGSVFGIPIKLGTSFLLVLPVLTWLIGSQVEMTAGVLGQVLGVDIDAAALAVFPLPWVLGLAAALGLFVGVLLHELGHSLVARRYGVAIDSITLWFLGGLAQLERFPDDWRQEFNIAIAGPVVSVLVGATAYALFVAAPSAFSAADLGGATVLDALLFVLGYLAILNVTLAVFNLLPGFPMDGGRILRALLSRKRGRLRATQIAAGVGKGFAVLLGILGIVFFQIFWIAIALFVYIGATSETRQVIIQAAFEGIDVRDVMTPAGDLKTVAPDTPLSGLVERMMRERHTGYPVLDGGDLVGIVTLEDVQRVDPATRDSVVVADVMSRELNTVSPDTDAEDAIMRIQRDGIGRLLVTDADGDLLGLVSRTDLMTVFEIVREGRVEAVEERAIP